MSAPPSESTTEHPLEPTGLTSNKTEAEDRKAPAIAPLPVVVHAVDKTRENSGVTALNQIIVAEESQGLGSGNERSSVGPPAERIPIHLFDEESGLKKLSYVGPVILGGASIVLTLVVWANTKTLTERQIDLLEKQTQLQEEQQSADQADMRTKFFNDLTSTDSSKKTFAAIGLAGHGRKAMPVVHFALGVEQREIRDSAVEVVHMLFQAEMTFEGRRELLNQLQNEFSSPNSRLQLGVIQSLVAIQPLMNSDERSQTMLFLAQGVPPETRCAESIGREMVQEVAIFSSVSDPNSILYLLRIARIPKCGFGWLQAIQKLVESAETLQPAARDDLRKKLQAETTAVLQNLRSAVSDAELSQTSGFGIFSNEETVSYEKFRERVEKEFNRLSQAFNEPERSGS